MSRVLCIGLVAAFACACGRGDHTTANNDNTAATGTAAQSVPDATGTSGTNESNQIVLTGCLQRADGNQAVGTSGTKGAPAETAAQSSQSAEFVLAHATAGAPDANGQPVGTSGVGHNGAGASGGPLVTGTDSYVLEGGDLAGHEHQTVRVTGHFPDPLSGGVLANRAPNSTSADSNAAAANPTSGSLAPNAKQRAQRGDTSNDVAHMRRVQVDSVEMVAAKCSAK